MLLSSSLEPNGARSSGHYLVLRHEGRRNLIKLPKAYEDLQKEVDRLYHLEPDQFYVESEELNLCAGERVEIPKDLWDDIAELLGNVHVVSRPVDAHPEPGPESSISSPLVHNTTQGVINLNSPLLKDELIVVNIGDIDIDIDPPSTAKLCLQVLDDEHEVVLSVRVFPLTGSIFLSSTTNDTTITHSLKEAFCLTEDHNIIIRKHGTSFQIFMDLQAIGTVEAPGHHSPLTSIGYDLGSDSLFKGPISATTYSGLLHLRETFKAYRKTFPPFDKDVFYQQISICSPRDADLIARMLSNVRREIASFMHCSAGIKWQGQVHLHKKWSNFYWNPHRYSIYVIRFTLQNNATMAFYVNFRPTARDNDALRIEMKPDNSVVFSECAAGPRVEYHTIKLTNRIHSPGDHSVAIISNGGQLHVVFDFMQSTILPRNTMIDLKPKETFNEFGVAVHADVYDFGV